MIGHLGVHAIHPSDFLCDFYPSDPKTVMFVLVEQAKAIGIDLKELLVRLQVSVENFVSPLRHDLAEVVQRK